MIQINVGSPGSMNDRAVLNESKLPTIIQKSQWFQETKYFILGDSAFPQCDWCLTKWGKIRNKTQKQKKFDVVHSQTRGIIEHTFGRLKRRWKILTKFSKNIEVNKIIRLF